MPHRRTTFFDDEDSILDDNILDSSAIFDSSLDMDRRRGRQMDAAAAIFSPSSEWDIDTDMMAGPADDSTPAPAFEHSNGTNNPFVKLEQAQPATFAQPHNWSAASGACTPTVYDNNSFGGAAFEAGSYAAGAFDGNLHITPLAVFQNANGVDTSMPSSPAVKEWGQADLDMNKRVRAQSPGPRSHSPLHVVRRDGIRKKNARFDIPAERTLMNIDQLIARSHDDNEIKELKQQKRLLRNRQAALDSRQRKKQHTERLEEEKKLHNAVIQELEDKIQQMQVNEEQLHHQVHEIVRERDFLRHKVETVQLEKENMIRSHTIETGELRKKNSYLTEQLQNALDNQQQQQSSGFSEAFGFDGSSFGLDNDWDNDPMEVIDISRPSTKSEKSDVEKPPAGLLLILLLCGAFVASQGASSAPSLPPLPKQLQTASASVLQNIFQDAGVSESTRVEVGPVTSDTWTVAKSDVAQMVGLESSMGVIDAYDAATKPTSEQQRDQIMQLTAAEYNDVTSNNFLRDPEPVNQRTRQRIHENLANMRTSKGSAAEVYTRSLLWDKLDAGVVRRFAAFARQAQAQQAASNNESGGAECHS